MGRVLAAWLAIGLGLGAAPASAQPSTLPFPPPPPAHAARLARDLLAGLAPALEGLDGAARVVFAVQVESDAPSAGRAETWLADTVEAAWRAGGWPLTRAPADGAEATHRLEVLVRVQAPSHVEAEARLRALPTSFWESLRMPEGAVLGTSTAEVPLNLELRTLFGLGRRTVRFERLRLVALAGLPDALSTAPLLDLALVTPEGAGDQRVVALQPDRLLVLRWAHGGLALEATVALAAAPSEARVRQPFGRLVVTTRPDGREAVLAASSDRAAPELYDLTLGPEPAAVALATLPPAWPLYASGVDRWLVAPWPAGVDVLGGPSREMALVDGRAAFREVGDLEPAYDLRTYPLFAATSPAWDPHFAVAHPGGDVAVWGANAPEERFVLDGAGTVSVASDLDQDGRPELLVSSSAVTGPDRLSFFELTDASEGAALRWSRPVPDPVTAALCGDLDGDGYAELLVATWSPERAGLWVVAPNER
ncbi:MAG: VCBS repeat-containing protein [Deltaproteobacteria bacterium]|nr:VCBS repeat-containing protein [Deltaproteobacteria bacterium]